MHASTTHTLTLTPDETAQADQLVRALEDVPVEDLRVVVSDATGREVVIPAAMAQFLQAALRAAASGAAVAVGTAPEELTSVEAAKALGMSRPTLLKMARAGKIPSHRVGTHTRFNASDIRALLHQRESSRVDDFNAFRDAERALSAQE